MIPTALRSQKNRSVKTRYKYIYHERKSSETKINVQKNCMV